MSNSVILFLFNTNPKGYSTTFHSLALVAQVPSTPLSLPIPSPTADPAMAQCCWLGSTDAGHQPSPRRGCFLSAQTPPSLCCPRAHRPCTWRCWHSGLICLLFPARVLLCHHNPLLFQSPWLFFLSMSVHKFSSKNKILCPPSVATLSFSVKLFEKTTL